MAVAAVALFVTAVVAVFTDALALVVFTAAVAPVIAAAAVNVTSVVVVFKHALALVVTLLL